MRVAARVVAAWVSIALLLAVLPAPTAHAQAPAPSAPAPDIFREALKVTGQAPGTPEEPPKAAGIERLPADVYEGMAAVATAFLIPGRIITCTAGGALGLLALVGTLGSGYRFATAIVEEGCGGKWILSAEDLLPERTMNLDAPEGR